MRRTIAFLMVMGASIPALWGCIPSPGGGIPPAPTSASSAPGFEAMAQVLAGLNARLNQVQGTQVTQAGDLENALAWGRAAHEAAQKPIPSMVGTAVGVAVGQPVGAIAAEVAGFLTVLAGFLFRKKT